MKKDIGEMLSGSEAKGSVSSQEIKGNRGKEKRDTYREREREKGKRGKGREREREKGKREKEREREREREKKQEKR